MPYNEQAVDREIAKDPRIKGKEARLIKSLLKGSQDSKTRLDSIDVRRLQEYGKRG